MAKGLLAGKNVIIGTVGYAFAEGIIDSFIGKFAGNLSLSSDMIELALGYYLKKRSGIVGSIGNAMFIINLYNVVKSMTGGSFNLLGITTSTTTTNGGF